jgi:hypothetical protein
MDVVKPNVALSALDRANVVPVQTGRLGQALLGKTLGKPKTSDGKAKATTVGPFIAPLWLCHRWHPRNDEHYQSTHYECYSVLDLNVVVN